MISGLIRGNTALILTIYIFFCMVVKIAWITPFAEWSMFLN